MFSACRQSRDAVSGSNAVLARKRLVINKLPGLSVSVVLDRHGKEDVLVEYDSIAGFVGKPLVIHVNNVVQG